jgi:prepilin-type N-terminal cleavage/methylation domain-containing protein
MSTRRTILAPRPAAARRAAAFTLLEMLVALAMAAIIAGSLYSALRIGFRARASAEASVEPIRTAEMATSVLRADFECAVRATGTLAGPFVGTDTTGDGGLPADAVSFYTLGNPADADFLASLAANQNNRAGAGGVRGAMSGTTSSAVPAEARKVEIGLVSYPGPDGAAEQCLVRRVTTNLLAQVAVEPDEEVLCRGVRAVNFRYFDGTTWQDSWDSTQINNNIPTAVEMIVELDRSSDGVPRIVRFPRMFLLSTSTVTTDTGMGTDAGTGTGTGTGTGGTP